MLKFWFDFINRFRALPLPKGLKKLATVLPVILICVLLASMLYVFVFDRSMAKTMVVVGVLLFFVLLFYGIQYLKKRRQRKESQEMNAGILDTAKDPRGVSIDYAEIESKFEEKLKDYIALLRRRSLDLYSIPWYAVIGERSSGKTTLIQNSGMYFEENDVKVAGGGGTLFIDWWLLNDAVILDTAGRLTISASDSESVTSVDSEQWFRFLKMLARIRPHCPLNGVIVVIPAPSLLEDDLNTIEMKSRRIKDRLTEIQKNLEVQFPIWIVVSKADRILGFTEFASELSATQQREMLGWSNPQPFDKGWDTEGFDPAFDQVLGSINSARLKILRRTEIRPKDAGMINEFPWELEHVREPLKNYIKDILMPSPYRDPFLFRGFYLTSGTQEELPIPSRKDSPLRMSGLLEDLRALFKSQAYFIRDLFNEKVIPEKSLVLRPKWAQKKYDRAKRTAWIASAVVIVLTAVLLGWAWRTWNESPWKNYVSEAKVDNGRTAKPGQLKVFKEAEQMNWRLAGDLPGSGEEATLKDDKDYYRDIFIDGDIAKWKGNWFKRKLSGVGTDEHVNRFWTSRAVFGRERFLRPLLQKQRELLLENNNSASPEMFETYLLFYEAALRGGNGDADPFAKITPKHIDILIGQVPDSELREKLRKYLLKVCGKEKGIVSYSIPEEKVWGYEKNNLYWGVFHKDPTEDIGTMAPRIAGGVEALDWWVELKNKVNANEKSLAVPELAMDLGVGYTEEEVIALLNAIANIDTYLKSYKPEKHSPIGVKTQIDGKYKEWFDLLQTEKVDAQGLLGAAIEEVEPAIEESVAQESPSDVLKKTLENNKAELVAQLTRDIGDVTQSLQKEYNYLVVISSDPALSKPAKALLECPTEELKGIAESFTWIASGEQRDLNPDTDIKEKLVAFDDKQSPFTLLNELKDNGVELGERWTSWLSAFENFDETRRMLWNTAVIESYWSYINGWCDDLNEETILRGYETGDFDPEKNCRNALTALATFRELLQTKKIDGKDYSFNPKRTETLRESIAHEQDRIAAAFWNHWKGILEGIKGSVADEGAIALSKTQARETADIWRNIASLLDGKKAPNVFEDNLFSESDNSKDLKEEAAQIHASLSCLLENDLSTKLKDRANQVSRTNKFVYLDVLYGKSAEYYNCEELYRAVNLLGTPTNTPTPPGAPSSITPPTDTPTDTPTPIFANLQKKRPSKGATGEWMTSIDLTNIYNEVSSRRGTEIGPKKEFIKACVAWHELLSGSQNVVVKIRLHEGGVYPSLYFGFPDNNEILSVYAGPNESPEKTFSRERFFEGNWILKLTNMDRLDSLAVSIPSLTCTQNSKGLLGFLSLLIDHEGYRQGTGQVKIEREGDHWHINYKEGSYDRNIDIWLESSGGPLPTTFLDWSVWE